jgi:hypothetical protein
VAVPSQNFPRQITRSTIKGKEEASPPKVFCAQAGPRQTRCCYVLKRSSPQTSMLTNKSGKGRNFWRALSTHAVAVPFICMAPTGASGRKACGSGVITAGQANKVFHLSQTFWPPVSAAVCTRLKMWSLTSRTGDLSSIHGSTLRRSCGRKVATRLPCAGFSAVFSG